jgi:hypothetical protein
MKQKLSLLDQALNEEKKLAIEKNRGKRKSAAIESVYDVMKFLLPNYEPNDKMKLWHEARQMEKGIKGGVRSGKTYGLAANAITLSYINRPYIHLSLTPTWDNAIETVVPVLEELCTDNGLPFTWIEGKGIFRIHHEGTAATILIVSAEGFFKGITAASGDVNEPFSIAKDKVMVWRERISHPKSKRLEKAWGGTAEPEKMNWGHEYFDKDIIDTKDIYVTRVTTYDNKHLSKQYIKSLEEMYDSKMREVYMKGKHVNLVQLPTYHQFDLERNVNHNAKVHNLGRGIRTMILSFDFNVDPMCAAEITKFGRVYIQTAEYKISNSNTAALCTFIIDTLDVRYATDEDKKKISIVITGDASGRQRKTSAFKTDYRIIMDAFESADYKFTMYVPEENPRVRDRVNIVNALLETRRFLIDETCKYSITDRGLVQWKESAEGFVIDKSKADRTHMSEACDYGLMVVPRLDEDESEIDIYTREQR